VEHASLYSDSHSQIKNTLDEFLGCAELQIDTSLVDAGVDSLIAVDVRKRLAEAFELQLPTTLVFDYPTIADIQAYISSMADPHPPTRAPPRPQKTAGTDTGACLAEIQNVLVDFLGYSDLHVDTSLVDAGVDSLIAVDIRRSLAYSFELPIPATLIFDYPTLGDIADFIQQLAGAAALSSETAPRHPCQGTLTKEWVEGRDYVDQIEDVRALHSPSGTSELKAVLHQILLHLLGDGDLDDDTLLVEVSTGFFIIADVYKMVVDSLHLQFLSVAVFDRLILAETILATDALHSTEA
jgi:acyl carrier protein